MKMNDFTQLSSLIIITVADYYPIYYPVRSTYITILQQMGFGSQKGLKSQQLPRFQGHKQQQVVGSQTFSKQKPISPIISGPHGAEMHYSE